MKRKSFLISSIAGIFSLHFPINLFSANYHLATNEIYNSLPLFNICTTTEIKKLGKEYLKQFPEENSISKLVSLIVNKDEIKPSINNSYRCIISEVINKSIKNDFQTDRIVIVNGYIISRTEARQAAVYQLHQN